MSARDTANVMTLARLLPLHLVGAGRGRHLIERQLLVYRTGWVVLLSGALEPVFYLFALGLGVGGLVGEVAGPGGTTVGYATFIAPGLLAAAAMNGTVFEMYNVFFKLHYQKLYDAALATPVAPRDIAVGEVAWSVVRAGLYAVGFLAVAVVFGLATSWWAVLAIPAAVLIGLCFAAATVAATTYMRSWQDFDLLLLFTIPMFLFSATFYPLDVYPETVRSLVQLSPLYHGVELIRGAMLGVMDPSFVAHAAVLLAVGVAGIAIATRRIGRLLLH